MGFPRRLLAIADPNHKLVHGAMKSVIVGGLGLAANTVRDIYDDKKANGFVQPPAAVFDDAFDELIALDECVRGEGYDYIREAYKHLQVILCTMIDEDTHYLMRALMFQELMFKRRDVMRDALEANKMYFNWQSVYADIMKINSEGLLPTGSQRGKQEKIITD